MADVTVVAEKIVALGGAKALVGIASLPPVNRRRPAVIMFNTGVVHRVGHHRMFVTLARELAQAGHLVLRFDLAGLGDSAERIQAVEPLVGNLDDIRDAVDWCVAQGASAVVLAGLCSGADHSIIYSGHDPRVQGVVLLDPSIPPTWRFYLIGLMRRVRRSTVPRRLLTRFAGPPAKVVADASDPSAEVWERPSIQVHRDDVRRFIEDAYRRAVDNHVSIFALFTSDFEHQHNYRRQILDAFPKIKFGARLELDYVAGVDHTFVLETHRRLLFDRITGWMARRFPETPAAMPVATSAAAFEPLTSAQPIGGGA